MSRPAREGCSIVGCDRPHNCRGWCRTHYMRWLKHGDPLTVATAGGGRRRTAEVVARVAKPPQKLRPGQRLGDSIITNSVEGTMTLGEWHRVRDSAPPAPYYVHLAGYGATG